MDKTCRIIKGLLYGQNMSDYQGSIVWSKRQIIKGLLYGI